MGMNMHGESLCILYRKHVVHYIVNSFKLFFFVCRRAIIMASLRPLQWSITCPRIDTQPEVNAAATNDDNNIILYKSILNYNNCA